MKSKLPREILSLINRKSHAAGVEEKKRLLTELEYFALKEWTYKNCKSIWMTWAK